MSHAGTIHPMEGKEFEYATNGKVFFHFTSGHGTTDTEKIFRYNASAGKKDSVPGTVYGNVHVKLKKNSQ